jgi:Ca2+-binding RTX toxin-like protein
MKKFGSNLSDSLFGTDKADVIYGLDGNDLISAWDSGTGSADKIYGGKGRDLISGLSLDVDFPAKSASRGAVIDGGAGEDTAIISLHSTAQTTMIVKVKPALTLHHVEDVIYHFDGLNSGQRVVGSDRAETIYLGDNNANGLGMDGNDYLFSGAGDDVLDGGDGNDLLSAGGGHNTLTGGKGADYFHFHLTQDYQYSEITDFKSGVDKIALFLDIDGVELEPARSYGDKLQLVNNSVDGLGYIDYDHGRLFDRGTFHTSVDDYFIYNMIYDKSTGSLTQRVYLQGDDGIQEYDVLLAHIDGNPSLKPTDFVFDVM